ncbi:alpha/beta fold hydrolase [uncultured Amnibacterium sp.]|uniref:alpha/beta fold hydrolase n=1 Tax=uncultured Amnibacterium sp. TaxID=1631851 RepID=UPI0035C97FF6
MGTISVGREHDADIDLYYEDHGSGPVVVLLHGWPLDSRSWEPQLPVLLDAGYRVVTFDMRGFGGSSRPADGYDFDTLAEDLDRVLTALDLRDATLVGFSFGTGEAVRYIGRHGTERVRALVLIESLAPSYAKSEENPQGVDPAGVDEVQAAIRKDRYAWLTGLLGNLFNLDELLGSRISEETVRATWQAAADGSPLATWACPRGWLEDYRADVARIDVPTLIVHGTADRILPIDGQARKLHELLPDADYVEIDGGPHAVCVTHAPEVNRALLDFLAAHR